MAQASLASLASCQRSARVSSAVKRTSDRNVAAADSGAPKVLFQCWTTEKQRAWRPRPCSSTVSSLIGPNTLDLAGLALAAPLFRLKVRTVPWISWAGQNNQLVNWWIQTPPPREPPGSASPTLCTNHIGRIERRSDTEVNNHVFTKTRNKINLASKRTERVSNARGSLYTF